MRKEPSIWMRVRNAIEREQNEKPHLFLVGSSLTEESREERRAEVRALFRDADLSWLFTGDDEPGPRAA